MKTQTLVLARSTDQFIAFQHANQGKDYIRINTAEQLRKCDPDKVYVVLLSGWYTRYNEEFVMEVSELITTRNIPFDSKEY